jgi:O-antigen biosynthesis protein WbqP
MRRKLYQILKRCFDIFASLIGLTVTFPLWLIAIIGIELSDPGPVFYKAVRIGKDNQKFTMWKFRSMRVPKNIIEQSEASFKADVNRIFPFGKFCRSTKIDELPQLLNILKGDMSVVGPRPAALDQVKVMRAGKYNIASTVRPGLTGTAALFDYIYGDTVENLDDYEKKVLPTRLELEAYYPKHMSVGYDLKLICYTVICIVYTLFNKTPVRIQNELIHCAALESENTLYEVSQ